MKIAIGADHAGFDLKNEIVDLLIDMGTGMGADMGVQCINMGTDGPQSVDYPDFAAKVSSAVSKGEVDRGILICGSGIGMSIVANKYPGVRAALCNDLFTARLSRLHNDANVLTMGERIVGRGLAAEIVKTWVETPFEGGRHSGRLIKISKIEEKQSTK